MFDGLDMHLYTLVALPFVAELLRVSPSAPEASTKASLIQGAFLMGWALGGAAFGRVGDALGRSRTLCLTILTYAVFTGLSYFSQAWWHLLIFRFLAALGIGGEWAVGASLLAETWPSRWRPWLAAILQTAVNTGVLLACFSGWALAGAAYKYIFLVGVVPALLVLWIRRAVPEPEVWAEAQRHGDGQATGVRALFAPALRRKTVIIVAICAMGLTAHWALMFWHSAHLRTMAREAGWPRERIDVLANHALYLLTIGAIIGNFLAGWLADMIGYRRAITVFFGAYFVFMMSAYGVVRDAEAVLFWLPFIGIAQGAFALFTMCLPPLFPTLVRTTGAGFCYNFGRIAAGIGTVFFGVFAVSDTRLSLLWASFLFLPAAAIALLMPEPSDEELTPNE